MTGFVILIVLVAALALALQLTHRRRDLRTAVGADVHDDADHRRLVAELRATPTQRSARPREQGPQEQGRQELVRLAA